MLAIYLPAFHLLCSARSATMVNDYRGRRDEKCATYAETIKASRRHAGLSAAACRHFGHAATLIERYYCIELGFRSAKKR